MSPEGAQSTSYGEFCVIDDSRGYNVQLNYTSSTRTLDFNLWCQNGKKFGDYGSFTAYSGNQYSFVFKVGTQGVCQGVLKDSRGAVIASTPYLNS